MTHTPADSRSEPQSTVLAALEVLVLAPLGFGATIVADAPAAAKRVRQELSNARFIGRLTVNQGVAQLRQRMEPTAEPDAAVDVIVEHDEHAEPVTVVVRPVTVGELALPDYDHLPAIDIVAKLEQLSPAERAAIGAYETANRQRRTVLGKLAQLSDAE